MSWCSPNITLVVSALVQQLLLTAVYNLRLMAKIKTYYTNIYQQVSILSKIADFNKQYKNS